MVGHISTLLSKSLARTVKEDAMNNIDLIQVGYVRKNVQGNLVYDSNGIAATLASQTGGIAGRSVGLYLTDEKESDSLTKTSEITAKKTRKFEPFIYVSLFAGIGGFEQALNNLGGSCVFASEIDKFAAQAYEALYGEKPAGDITEIDAKDIPNHDLLVGGFPCQSFSVAGKRAGFDDVRGTLFFEIARIAEEKKPKALLLE